MTVAVSSDLHKPADTHANRPAATAVPVGALFSCTTHSLVYRSDGTSWATWATLGGGGGGAVASVVAGTGISVDDTDPANPVVSATGGGGGGAGNSDPRWTPLTGQTTVDEFADSSLDGAWSLVESGAHAGYTTWTEAGDSLSAYHNANADASAELHAMMRPLSGAGGAIATGDAFVTSLALTGLSGTSQVFAGGIVLADGATYNAGQQVVGLAFNQQNQRTVCCFSLAGYNSLNSAGTSMAGFPLSHMHMRLAYLGSNTWRADVSLDGVSWVKGSTFSRTITATHVGLLVSNWSNAIEGVASYDYLRRVSGVS